jgi:3-keto-5-aminohexanoate cleavage enzyme
MDNKIIITAAVTGSRPTKKMNPAVPYTPREIIRATVDCYKIGASVVHIHARDPESGKASDEIGLYKEIVEGIREKCDIIVNLTTSSAFVDAPGSSNIKRRLQTVDLKPDMCSFDLGSINFPDRTFLNLPEWSDNAPQYMRERCVKPEIEVFDTGHIYQAIDLIKRGVFSDPPYFQLCMGIKWGMEATIENLLFMKSKLPSNAQWSVLGIGGKKQTAMITMGILLGGHVRVGFEDNIYLSKGILAKSNAEFVEKAADLALRLGRTVATPKEAREILGIIRP